MTSTLSDFTGPVTGKLTVDGEVFDLAVADDVVRAYDRVLRRTDRAAWGKLINADLLLANWQQLRNVLLQPLIAEFEAAHRPLRLVGRRPR